MDVNAEVCSLADHKQNHNRHLRVRRKQKKTMSISRSEAKIQAVTEGRNKNIRVMSTLLSEGRENSNEYKALEKAVAEAEEDIATLRKLASHPAIIAVAEKEEAEQRDRVNQQLTSSVVSAVKETISAPAIIKTEDRSALVVAYRRFLYNGELESRDLTQTGSGISLVPAGFDTTYKQALKLVSPLAATVQSVESSRITKLFSVSDVTSNQTLFTEGSSVGASVDPVFSSFTALSTDSGVSILKAAWQMLQDAAFDMQNFISVITKGRVARFYDAAILRGTDPTGTVLPNSVAGGLLASVTSGVVQAGGAGSLATGWKFTDAVALVNSISDVAYNEGAAFLVSPKMRAYILSNFLSTTGKPLYKFVNGELYLLGKPVYSSNYFPTYGASTVQALYGRLDLSFSYQYFNRLYKNTPLPETMESQFSLETRFAGSPTQIASSALVALTTSAS
jgi:HK97 family phage major capsid protein